MFFVLKKDRIIYEFNLLFCCYPIAQIYAQQSKLTLPASTTQQQSSAFELINLTSDSSILGYLKISPESNEREAVITPTDKQQWLQNIVASEVTKAADQDGDRVLFILHDISVGRTTTGNYARLKAVVYTGGDNGYVLARQVDTLVTGEARDIDDVGALIAKAVAANLEGLSAAQSPEKPSRFYTRDEVIQSKTDRYAFIRRSANPNGIYMSYEEFKAGKSSFEHFYLKREDESSRLTVHSFTETDSTLRPVEPWAIAVSNEIYFYSSHKLYPVEAVGNNLVFSKFIDPETRKNNAAFWRMTIGDKIKGRESNIFDNENTLVVDNYRSTKLTGEAIRINADTGAAEW